MKTTLLRVLSLCLIALVGTGCISQNFDVNFPFIETDVETVTAAAVVPDGQDMIAGAFKVNSNQTWTAVVTCLDQPELQWCSLLVSEHENLLGESQETLVPFVLGRNRTSQPRRATVKLTSADCEAALTIVQDAAELYIELYSGENELLPEDVVEIGCIPESRIIDVKSNDGWTVSVEEGATAQVSLDKKRGSDDGSVTVSFAENFDTANSRTANVVFTTSSGIVRKVVFNQSPAVPYANVSADQLLIEPDAESASLTVSSNTSWSVAVKDASGWPGFTLNTTSGDADSDKIEATFPMSGTPAQKKVVLSLTPQGGSAKDITLVQTGMVLVVNFVSQPFDKDILIGGGKGVYVDSSGEYIYDYMGNTYGFAMKINSSQSAAEINYIKYDPATPDDISRGTLRMSYAWLEFPAISGMALTSVTVHHGATDKPFIISEKDGTKAVPGGTLVKLAKGQIYTWTLTQPEKDKVYALYMTQTMGRIREVKLIYR